jgi:RNA polymerase sigma factor (sigma-70 family)
MSTQEIPRRPSNFEEFFRSDYRPLMRDVIFFAGGKPHEAEDVVSEAMIEVLQRWESIENPRAYARRAAIRILFKDRKRELQIQERLIQSGQVPPEYDLDPGLTVREQQEWVTLFLKRLPPAQREVLACMFDALTPREIAQFLGKTEAAVRRNLWEVRRKLADCLAEIDGAEEAQ